jgi:hypothetical protein
MRSNYEQSGARPSALIRDPLVEQLIGASDRQPRALVSPQLAHAASGKSLVPFWRRWWRSW